MSRKGQFKTHCKRGHERTVDNIGTNGTCKECFKITSSIWWESNPEKAKAFSKNRNEQLRGNRHTDLEYMRAYYTEHKDKQLANEKERYENEPEFRDKMKIRARISQLKRYGWTPEAVAEAKVKQDNRCAICNEVFTSTPNSDHDHETGKPRELLCGNHNRMLGLAKDNPVVLEAAASYLRKWGK